MGDGKPGGVTDTADGVAQKPQQPGEMDGQEPCESQGRETQRAAPGQEQPRAPVRTGVIQLESTSEEKDMGTSSVVPSAVQAAA